MNKLAATRICLATVILSACQAEKSNDPLSQSEASLDSCCKGSNYNLTPDQVIFLETSANEGNVNSAAALAEHFSFKENDPTSKQYLFWLKRAHNLNDKYSSFSLFTFFINRNLCDDANLIFHQLNEKYPEEKLELRLKQKTLSSCKPS